MANEPGRPRQSRHGVPPRLPRGRPAHALAARPDQARVSARCRGALLDRVFVGRPAHRPAPRPGRARPRAERETGGRFCRRHGGADGSPERDASSRSTIGLVEALDSDRYRRLLSEWKAFLERPAPAESEARNADRPLGEVVSRRAWRLSRRIARAAPRPLTSTPPPERLHEVRIDAKKLRYLIDVTPAFYDAADLERILGGSEEAAARARRLQRRSRAGEAAARVRARRCAPPAGQRAPCLPSGGLAEESRQRRERLREQVVDGLARFRADDTRSACRRAFKGPDARGARAMSVVADLQHEGRRRKDHDGGQPVVSRGGGRPADPALGPRPAGGVQLRLPRYGRASQGSAGRAWRAARRSPTPSRRPTTPTSTCCRRTSLTASSIGCSVTSASRNAS